MWCFRTCLFASLCLVCFPDFCSPRWLTSVRAPKPTHRWPRPLLLLQRLLLLLPLPPRPSAPFLPSRSPWRCPPHPPRPPFIWVPITTLGTRSCRCSHCRRLDRTNPTIINCPGACHCFCFFLKQVSLPPRAPSPPPHLVLHAPSFFFIHFKCVAAVICRSTTQTTHIRTLATY